LAATPSPVAVHRRRIKELKRFIHVGEHIIASWENYTEEHTDHSGLPHDESDYAEHERHRNARLWWTFTDIRHNIPQLLTTAEFQLQQIPARSVQTRWAWQLNALTSAQDSLKELRAEWENTRDTLLANVWPGMEEYEEPARDRNTAAVEHIVTWVTHGPVIGEIHTAAVSTIPAPPALTTTPAPTAASGQSVPARRWPRPTT
jgi:hypothetical protein